MQHLQHPQQPPQTPVAGASNRVAHVSLVDVLGLDCAAALGVFDRWRADLAYRETKNRRSAGILLRHYWNVAGLFLELIEASDGA
jgi:hypothetical protein